jgi:hypothetical protein
MHSTAAAVAGGDSGYWHLMEFQLEITIVSIAAAAAAAAANHVASYQIFGTGRNYGQSSN